MSRNSPFDLFRVVTGALALIAVVLVIGFGASLHSDGVVVDDAVAHTSILADGDQDGLHKAIGVQTPSSTHCGSGAVCIADLPSAPTSLPVPETSLARFAIADLAVPLSPNFGLLRPPRRS